MLFGGFSSTRVTKSNLGCRENPYFEKLADLRQIWPYSQVQGPDSHMQSGARRDRQDPVEIFVIVGLSGAYQALSLIHISEPTRRS